MLILSLQKHYDEVVADCCKALENNKKYTKALFRRGKAYESLGNLTKCLEGKFHILSMW